MSYASPADILKRHDARTIGQLVADDGTEVSASGLLTDANLQAALDDASGQINAALLVGGRYTVSDLTGLTGNSLSYLKKLTCLIAFAALWDRRNWLDDDRRDEAIKRQKEALEMLRKGQNVFDMPEENIAAGNASYTYPQRVDVLNTNLLVDECRGNYYPARRFPRNG